MLIVVVDAFQNNQEKMCLYVYPGVSATQTLCIAYCSIENC